MYCIGFLMKLLTFKIDTKPYISKYEYKEQMHYGGYENNMDAWSNFYMMSFAE